MSNVVDPFEGYWTVEEASRFLDCVQPVPLAVLRQLGKDASLYCRIHGVAWKDKPVIGKSWPTERAYTQFVLCEVFSLHPQTRDFVAPAR
jgi:hypothetical protein